ncbi:MAG TPA: hypothetical protein DD376_00990 [Sutterella sp.]|nr:hypothetical protein [Sutterella sp.]
MAYDLEEQESLDQLKAWWEKWGTLITVVITVACLAFAGYNGYRYYEKSQGAKATAMYVQLQNALVMDEKKNVKSLSEGLMKEYPKHIFASLAAFARAAAAVSEDDLDGAKKALTWVIEVGKRPEYETLARVRLAGIDLDLGKPQGALAVLKAATPKEGDAVIYNDRLGDVYYALGDVENARKAWKASIEADKRVNTLTPFVTIKLESLPAE